MSSFPRIVFLDVQNHIGLLTCDRPSISILVPFCGKSVDMHWLWQQGHTVVGVEISELAAKQFFEENEIPYHRTVDGDFTVLSDKDNKLKYFLGDLYSMSLSKAGPFDAIWDSKALTAVNVEDRTKYVSTLLSLLKPDGRILLSTCEYNQEEYSGPPLSIPYDIIKTLFGAAMSIEQIENFDISNTGFTTRFHVSRASRLLHLLTPIA